MLNFHFHFKPEENNGKGTMYFIGFSDPSIENLVPLPEEVVRGEMPIAGWRLEDISTNPSHPKIKVTQIFEVNFRGSMPNFILGPAFKDQVVKLARIKNLVKKGSASF